MAKAKSNSGGSPKYPAKNVPLQKAANKAAIIPELPSNFHRSDGTGGANRSPNKQ